MIISMVAAIGTGDLAAQEARAMWPIPHGGVRPGASTGVPIHVEHVGRGQTNSDVYAERVSEGRPG